MSRNVPVRQSLGGNGTEGRLHHAVSVCGSRIARYLQLEQHKKVYTRAVDTIIHSPCV
ncbi:MAG: hypothetical protein K0R57_2046 [Paenibacillaceae bacterium]|jgi:hypothetical protein|nr:hypothetical protein [Paenibacillaceae bacterium]